MQYTCVAPSLKGPLESKFLYPLSSGTQAFSCYTVIHWVFQRPSFWTSVHSDLSPKYLHLPRSRHLRHLLIRLIWVSLPLLSPGMSGAPCGHWLAHSPWSVCLHRIWRPLWSLFHPLIWVSLPLPYPPLAKSTRLQGSTHYTWFIIILVGRIWIVANYKPVSNGCKKGK